VSADSEHIELLRRGPRPWNEWRAEHPHIVPNLVGISLSIGDRQLGPINGGPINLAHARLRHASLRYATLTGADLRGADLADTDLRDARLERADLSGADLSDALLDRADLAGADLTAANLCGANLAETRNLTTAQLHAAEGDAATVLPAHVERPLIWTVSQVVDSQPIAVRPANGRHAETRENDRAQDNRQESQHVSWFIGGPRSLGRSSRSDDGAVGESGGF
jgi:pentapeptide repeat protein